MSDVEAFNLESEDLLMKNAYLDLITQELANRGTPKSETQLKYDLREKKRLNYFLILIFLDI